MFETAFLVPLLPLISFALLTFWGRKLPGKGSFIAIGAIGWGLFHSLWILFSVLMTPGKIEKVFPLYDFFKLSENAAPIIEVAYRIDGLTAAMMVVVTLVSFLVHIYSLGYMGYNTPSEDVRFTRFYGALSLFSFSMLILVMTDNFAVLFIGWELVGFCSYLLIGHWFEKDYPDPKQITPREAGLKAFLTTKFGDLGLAIGMLAIYGLCVAAQQHDPSVRVSFNMRDVEAAIQSGLANHAFSETWLTVVCLLLFCGAVGKSAQFPLHTWLPDAMEGPTPVSALIHAATMVAAGVYLVARIFPMLVLAPVAGWAIAYVGGFTALFAASIALVQFDIKKVLAYSTISQLGYMMLSLGVGAADTSGGGAGYQAGLMHLTTHAMFKACLFLCSGSVIHAMEHALHQAHSHKDPQDMRNMGGLFSRTGAFGFLETIFLLPFMPIAARFKPKYRDAWNSAKMPMTFWTMLVATVAISGVPLFSGFISKDAILGGTFSFLVHAPGIQKLFVLPLAIFGFGAAFLTAFYMFRLIYMTFFGESKMPEEAYAYVHESPKVMTVPLGVLAVLSFWIVFSLDPTGLISHGWFHREVEPPARITVEATDDHAEGRPEGWSLLAIASAEEPASEAPEEGETGTGAAEADEAEAIKTDAASAEAPVSEAEGPPPPGEAHPHGSVSDEAGGGEAHPAASGPPHAEADAHGGSGHGAGSKLIHLIALIASIAIAFTGIRYSREWYAIKKGEPEKLAAKQYPRFYDQMYHKYYFDEYYDSFVVKPGLSTARFAFHFDNSVIDAFVNLCGATTVLLSHIKAVFDDYVVDSLVDAVGEVTKFAGDAFRRLQTGLVQSYLVYITLLVVVATILMLFAG